MKFIETANYVTNLDNIACIEYDAALTNGEVKLSDGRSFPISERDVENMVEAARSAKFIDLDTTLINPWHIMSVRKAQSAMTAHLAGGHIKTISAGKDKLLAAMLPKKTK